MNMNKKRKAAFACVLSGALLLAGTPCYSSFVTEHAYAEAETLTVTSMQPTQGPVVEANETGGSGFTFPVFNGDESIKYEQVAADIRLFAKTEKDAEWVSIDNNADSGWIYDQNFGHFWDGPGGFWFHVKKETYVRLQSASDPSVYLDYTITADKVAPRPDPSKSEKLVFGTEENPEIDGWNLVWNDEFSGNEIEGRNWTHQTGYFLNEDPGTWGWGNAELEYYTDSPKNSYVSDGKLTLKILDEPKSFPEDPNRTAPYSSAKLVSKDTFAFKYGRIDFCAKVPSGTGIWPALWLLPENEEYGTWAASGEIDVMEAKGRLNNTIYGTIHYGGSWPANRYSGDQYVFEDGKTYDDGFHIYSVVWEKEQISWYVDGICYSVIPSTEWFSATDESNPYAPFDKEFYIIMSLAAGGNFDEGRAPEADLIPSEMQVDYVRVYQAKNDPEATHGVPLLPDPPYEAFLNASDVINLQKYLFGVSDATMPYDLDNNGKTDIRDLIILKEKIISYNSL